MQHRWHWLLAGWMVLTAPALTAGGSPAADETLTFRTEVREVRLAFAASDARGKAVRNLSEADVAVVDNERIVRRFRSFGTTLESPLNLVILLDASGSLEKSFAGEIAAVREFIAHTSWGERDRVSILFFGGSAAEMVCAHNCASQTDPRKLDGLRAGGLTPLYDALVEAEAWIRREDNAEYRSALLLFSDGVDTISRHSLADAAQSAQDLQLPVYSVNPCTRKCAEGQGDAVLEALATRTGGVYLGNGTTAREFLRAVVEDLHSGYVVTYSLPLHDGQTHRVQVLATRNPNLSFRHRTQYHDTGYLE